MNADGEAFTGIVSYTRANSVCEYQKLLSTFNGELGKSSLPTKKNTNFEKDGYSRIQ